MKDDKIKEPVQKRAINTRIKIMDAAIALYAKQGYHHVAVDDIASAAGVSTGIAYRYFKNKKDLLLNSIQYMAGKIQGITETEKEQLSTFQSIPDMLAYILNQFEALHREYYAFHEELEGLRHTDADVKKIYDEIENKAIHQLIEAIQAKHFNPDNLKEKVSFSVSVMENYCHMAINEKYADLDLVFLKNNVIKIVIQIMMD